MPVPVNTAAPVTTYNKVTAGDSVTVSEGVWENSPTSYDYAWWKQFEDDDPVDLEADEAVYEVTPEDVGCVLSCVVTATNASGSADATSNSTPFVIGPPLSLSQPLLNGRYSVHTEWLTTYNFIPPFTSDQGERAKKVVSFRWELVDAETEEWVMSANGVQDESVYLPVPADVGYKLYCEVTVETDLGKTSASSTLSGVVEAEVEEVPNTEVEHAEDGTSSFGKTYSIPEPDLDVNSSAKAKVTYKSSLLYTDSQLQALPPRPTDDDIITDGDRP